METDAVTISTPLATPASANCSVSAPQQLQLTGTDWNGCGDFAVNRNLYFGLCRRSAEVSLQGHLVADASDAQQRRRGYTSSFQS